jgi:hypothetical protein
MNYRILAPVLILSLACTQAQAGARQIDDYQWEGVGRVVAIGDLHGDYGNYLATLQAAGLVDRKGKWSGGETHLVQTGDVPDRGPDTLKILEHLDKLARQAERKGGRVHSLIGNHEAMNVYGDLRYVHEGEYQAFVTRNSEALRDRYYALYLQALEQQDPEGFAALPADYREKWNAEHPLGWVEHRQAWDPAFDPKAELGNRVLNQRVAVRINDTVFLHGGISGFYCRNSLESLTRMVHEALRQFDPQNPSILEDEYGPLWYRGLAGEEPAATPETVDAILAHHGIARIVIGHTPTSGVIWPRYDGKVVMIDTGISAAYGGNEAWLEISPDGLFAGYPGGRLPLPAADAGRIAYLEQVSALSPANPYLKRRLEQLQQPALPAAAPGTGAEDAAAAESDAAEPAAEDTADAEGEAAAAAAPAPAVRPVPVCGITE